MMLQEESYAEHHDALSESRGMVSDRDEERDSPGMGTSGDNFEFQEWLKFREESGRFELSDGAITRPEVWDMIENLTLEEWMISGTNGRRTSNSG